MARAVHGQCDFTRTSQSNDAFSGERERVRRERAPIAPQRTMADSNGFAAVRSRFIAELRFRNRSRHTLAAYERDLDDLVAHLERQGVRSPTEVQPMHLQAHIAFLGSKDGRIMSVASTNRKIATLQAFFQFLRESHLISDDPSTALDRPKRPFRIPEFLSPDQTKRLVEAPRPDHGDLWVRDRAILELLYGAGVRAGQYLIQAGKAFAAMDGRFSVAIDDIRKAAPPVLRHRILTNFAAESEGIRSDQIVDRLLEAISGEENANALPEEVRVALRK